MTEHLKPRPDPHASPGPDARVIKARTEPPLRKEDAVAREAARLADKVSANA